MLINVKVIAKDKSIMLPSSPTYESMETMVKALQFMLPNSYMKLLQVPRVSFLLKWEGIRYISILLNGQAELIRSF